MLGAGQNNGRQTAFGTEQPRDLPWVKVIPYDHVVKFDLRGAPGNLLQDVISVSAEGVFVANSIGYGFQEDRAEKLNLVIASPPPSNLGEIALADIPPDVLIEGFRIAPEFESVAINNGALNENLPIDVAQDLFQRIRPPERINFLLSIVDSATGRELQNEPVHSVATLGDPNGRRPFKSLSQPMVFMPRSTIRIQVEETMQGVRGTLFITLQGYKVLGVAGNVEEAVRTIVEMDPRKKIPVYDYETGKYRTLGEATEQDVPTTGVVPFDYVSTLDLKGRPKNIVEDEVPINVDGGYITLALGYSLDPKDTSLEVDLRPNGGQVDLNNITLKDIKPAQALLDGIRIHPIRVRFAFSGGSLSAAVPEDTASRVFQRMNFADDVRFLYSIIDSGTGRELQNQPVYNIAGLGTASGERPFRVLHKPMVFLPRSTIRVQVQEISGRGRLFIVFQGYKLVA